MRAADGLEPALRATTWRTLIGLLAVTGMRQGEACRLHQDDVDLSDATLVIRDSKFGKSRQVFLHPTTAAALRAYERPRARMFPELQTDTFLVQQPRQPAGRAQHPAHVRRPAHGRRDPGPARSAPPAAA